MNDDYRKAFEAWLADPVWSPKIDYFANIKKRGLSFNKFLGAAPKSSDPNKFLLGTNDLGSYSIPPLSAAGDYIF